MHKRLLSLTLSLLLLAGGAHAADKPKEVGQYVDLQPVGLPIVVNHVLVNYVFVYVRINLQSGADVIKLRDKEPMFRDALVRAGHRAPFIVPGDWQRIDEAKLDATLAQEAELITGPGAIASVVVTSQTPQKRVMPPRPQPPPTP